MRRSTSSLRNALRHWRRSCSFEGVLMRIPVVDMDKRRCERRPLKERETTCDCSRKRQEVKANIAPMRSLLALLLLLPLALHAAPDADPDFLMARDAWRASSWPELESALPRLKGHVLEPYAQYWHLQLRIKDAPLDEIHAFLRANEG